jgi:GMP reductase
MKILEENKLDFDNVLLVPQPSDIVSRSNVKLTRTFKFKHSGNIWNGIPIIAANMTTVSNFVMATALSGHKLMTALPKYYDASELSEFFNNGYANTFCWYTLGTSEDEFKKFKKANINKVSINNVCIDVANGYRATFVDSVKKFRDENPGITIMAGNVVTPDMVYDLVNAGADIVKVGIGGGSGCLTRIKTGVGYPQLSAIIECGEAAHSNNAFICSDGGCKTPGDIAKAFAASADFVMIGSMLAGHDEVSAKRIIDENGKLFVEFYGMSSEKAMHSHGNGMPDYRTSEGRQVLLPARGPVNNTILDILGGIRSTLTYVGAAELENLSDKSVFVKVNETHNKIYEQMTKFNSL